jgi:hypothetical protein
VLASEWARPGGVPLAGLGAAFFGASLLLQAGAVLGGGVAPVWLAGAAFLPALPLSVLLVLVQVRMRRFCTLCMAVHAVDVGGAAVFLLGLAPRVALPPEGLLPAALLLALLFGLLLSSTVPHLSRGEEDDSLKRDWARLQRSPLTSLARLSFEQPVALDGEALGARLGEAPAPHALVVLAHPTCAVCGPVLEALEGAVARHGDRLRAYVGVPPRAPDDVADVALCEALACVGVAHGGGVFLQAFRVAKQSLARLREAPEPLAELAALTGLERGALEAVREEARARVHAASAVRSAHARGLPALFLDGRYCEAPMAHIEAWCERPELLAVLTPPTDSTPQDLQPEETR